MSFCLAIHPRCCARFVAVAALSASAGSTASASVFLDDYSVQFGASGLSIFQQGVGTSRSETNGGVVIAGTMGTRTATVTLTHVLSAFPMGTIDMITRSIDQPTNVDGNYTLQPGRFLELASSAGTAGFSINLLYTISATNLAAHGTRFEFEMGSADFDADNRGSSAAWIPLEITVVSSGGTASSSVLVSDEGLYSIDFASFAGVDFTSVTQIGVNFGGQVVTPDFALGTIQIVPTPSAAALLALAGVIGARRRR